MLNSFWEEIGRFTICTVKLRGKYIVSLDCLGLWTIYLIICIYSRYKLLSVYNNLGTQHAPKSSMFKKKKPCFFFEKKWEHHNIFLGVYRTQMFVPWPLPSLAICFSTCKRTVSKRRGKRIRDCRYTWIFLLCVRFVPFHQQKPTKRQKCQLDI